MADLPLLFVMRVGFWRYPILDAVTDFFDFSNAFSSRRFVGAELHNLRLAMPR